MVMALLDVTKELEEGDSVGHDDGDDAERMKHLSILSLSERSVRVSLCGCVLCNGAHAVCLIKNK